MKFSYACDNCQFDVCVSCTFEERLLLHEGHKEHTLTLMQRVASFECDACGVKDEDSSYVYEMCYLLSHNILGLSSLSN